MLVLLHFLPTMIGIIRKVESLGQLMLYPYVRTAMMTWVTVLMSCADVLCQVAGHRVGWLAG